MNALTESLTRAMIHAHSRIDLLPTITQPAPNFQGPGVSALGTLEGVGFAIALSLGVLGCLVSAMAMTVGHFARNERAQSMGFKGLMWCLAGVAVAASAAGLVTWGQHLKVI